MSYFLCTIAISNDEKKTFEFNDLNLNDLNQSVKNHWKLSDTFHFKYGSQIIESNQDLQAAYENSQTQNEISLNLLCVDNPLLQSVNDDDDDSFVLCDEESASRCSSCLAQVTTTGSYCLTCTETYLLCEDCNFLVRPRHFCGQHIFANITSREDVEKAVLLKSKINRATITKLANWQIWSESFVAADPPTNQAEETEADLSEDVSLIDECASTDAAHLYLLSGNRAGGAERDDVLAVDDLPSDCEVPAAHHNPECTNNHNCNINHSAEVEEELDDAATCVSDDLPSLIDLEEPGEAESTDKPISPELAESGPSTAEMATTTSWDLSLSAGTEEANTGSAEIIEQLFHQMFRTRSVEWKLMDQEVSGRLQSPQVIVQNWRLKFVGPVCHDVKNIRILPVRHMSLSGAQVLVDSLECWASVKRRKTDGVVLCQTRVCFDQARLAGELQARCGKSAPNQPASLTINWHVCSSSWPPKPLCSPPPATQLTLQFDLLAGNWTVEFQAGSAAAAAFTSSLTEAQLHSQMSADFKGADELTTSFVSCLMENLTNVDCPFSGTEVTDSVDERPSIVQQSTTSLTSNWVGDYSFNKMDPLAKLIHMGFLDHQHNCELLVKHNNQLDDVVNALLDEQRQS